MKMPTVLDPVITQALARGLCDAFFEGWGKDYYPPILAPLELVGETFDRLGVALKEGDPLRQAIADAFRNASIRG
jgi:hypothetical protein